MYVLNKAIYGAGRGSDGTLSFWLPLSDAGSGAVNTAPARSAGSPTATFTRATSATTFDVTGSAPILVNSGVARSYYDPATHVYLGYLAEEQRTNLLLNSKIDGTILSTQSVTVTAQAYTLAFYGTGTVTLSGTATGAKVGTGAYPTRSSFTFTPTAGTLTLTVTGTVQYAQLEAGAFATSFIPTAGATVTRNADVLTYATSGNMLGTAGTCYAEATWSTQASGTDIISAFTPTSGIPMNMASAAIHMNDGADRAIGPAIPATASSVQKLATRWDGAALTAQGCANGTLGSGTAFDGDMNFGAAIGIMVRPNSTSWPTGTIHNVRIWTRALTDAQLTTLTA